MALFVRILGGSFPSWNCRYSNSLEQREIGYAMYEKEKQNIPTKAGKCNATLVPRNLILQRCELCLFLDFK